MQLEREITMVIYRPNISNYKSPKGNKIWLCSIMWLMVLVIFCRKGSFSSFLFYYHWIGYGVLDIWSWNDSRLCLCVRYLGSSQNYVWCETCHVFIKGISYFTIWLAFKFYLYKNMNRYLTSYCTFRSLKKMLQGIK